MAHIALVIIKSVLMHVASESVVTNFHLYTKGASVGTQSCKGRTKWKTSFSAGDCKALEGVHTSKNRPWQSWTSIMDRFHKYYYRTASNSCNESGNSTNTQPTLRQYYDSECVNATGFSLSQVVDRCGDWLVGSDNATKYERYRLDCGLATSIFGCLRRTWLPVAAVAIWAAL